MMNSTEVRLARSTLGLSQRAFAKEVGVSYVTVARWETNRFRPSRLAVRNIEMLLAVHKVLVQGLQESAEGKTKYKGSFAKYVEAEEHLTKENKI